jgi:sulfite reductase (NADPH) flavoprotein alpha-component
MDVAFSRDTAIRTYVQHRLIERAREVYAWMEEGAHLYVCGDANGLAPDVHEALATVSECASGRDRDGAEAYLRAMQQARRYQRDVY